MKEDFKGLHILIVDDEEDLREILCDGFALRGADVDSAADAECALAMIRERKFDVVISDVRMPKGGGRKLLQELPQTGKEFPQLVLISGFSDIPEEEAFRMGAKAVVTKPFDFATIYNTVKKLVS